MAIYDYKTNASTFGERYLIPPGSASPRATKATIRTLVEDGHYQEALDQIKNSDGDICLINLKAVLFLRLNQSASAANLLRSYIWDLATFTMKPDVPVHIQLNFATALLLTGHVSGALDVIRANENVGNVGNEQAIELLADIDQWEKSMSVFCWLDWKVCGIEHIKGAFPTKISLPGRFDWELDKAIPGDFALNHTIESMHSHKLAC